MSKIESKRPVPGTGPAERQYALRICVNKAIYEKLLQAHDSVRREDGSRAELRELLEKALDALLGQARTPTVPPASEPDFAEDDEEAPTVRNPVTQRWHPALRS